MTSIKEQPTTIAEQPTVEERWQEYELLLEVFKMCSWGGLELYVELPHHTDETGSAYFQATALPPEEMDKPEAERRTTVTTMPFPVYLGPPPMIAKRRQQESVRQESGQPDSVQPESGPVA